MKLTPAFKWSLACLIPLTFSWKLLVEHPSSNETEGHTVRFLAAHGFDVAEETVPGPIPIMRATKGNCSMIVMEAAPDGSRRDVMRHLAPTTDRQFVVFGGKVYDEQPVWLTVTEDWWTRFLRKIGMSQVEKPTLMVAASLSCAAEQLPWIRL